MKLIVNPHKIQIIKEPVNEREIDITKCEFEFADEITDEFTKEAYFTLNGETYKQIIVNDECDIPYEVLRKRGTVEIGVVAFIVENGEEIKRYNPSPIYVGTLIGSLKEEYENSAPITPTDLEQLENILTNKQDRLVSGENIKTINNQSLLGSGNINTGTYSKPSGGIPKSDLASAVQASLSKADTALQTEQYTGTYSKPSGGIPKSDLAITVQTSLGKADTALQEHQSLSNYYTKSEADNLLNDKEDRITSTNKLSADLIDDTNTTHKFTTAIDILKLSGIESGAEVNDINSISVNGTAQTITNKNVDIIIPDPTEYIYISPSGDTSYATDGVNIQNAINSANTNGKAVFFRNGTYYVEAPLIVYNNTILLGNIGKNEIRTKSNSSVITVSSGTSVSGLVLQGLNFLNQNQIDSIQKIQSGNFLEITGRGIYVNNCSIRNYYQVFGALEVCSYITNSKFTAIYNKFANLTTDSLVDGNYINASKFAILRNSTVITNLSSTTFSNNFVDYFCTVFGSYHTNTTTHSSIVGNTFDRCLSVFHDSIQRMTIAGNNFSNMLYESNRWASGTSSWSDKYVMPDPSNTNKYIICNSTDEGAILATSVLENAIWSIFKFDDKTADSSTYTLRNHVFSNVVFTGNMGEKVNYYFYVSSSMVSTSNIGICTNNCRFDNNTILKGVGGTAYTSSDYDVSFSGVIEDQELSDYEVHLRGASAYGYMENTYFDFMDMKKYSTFNDLPSPKISTNNCVSFPYMKAIVTNDNSNNGVWLNNEGSWQKITDKENKGKITISGTEKTPSSHTLSWTDNGVSHSYEVVTV